MTLTTEQIEFIKTAAILFIFTVGLLYILRTLFRKVRNAFHAVKVWFVKRKNKRKGKRGYQNYKGDIWYPDGTVYNAETGKLDKPDYKN